MPCNCEARQAIEDHRKANPIVKMDGTPSKRDALLYAQLKETS